MLRHRLLALFTAAAGLPAVGALVAGCTDGGGGGGGHGATPCCAATGQVEGPASLAGGSFAGISIRPVLLDTAACIGFDGGLEDFTQLPRAGTTGSVDPVTGTYQLRLYESAIGRKVAFLACESGCEVVRGVGLLGVDVVPTGVNEFLQVGPIQLSSPGGAPGASTLETLADCELDLRNIRGNLITADVRHVITSAIAQGAAPTSAFVDDLMGRLQDFDDGMTVAILAAGTDVAAFHRARAEVEAALDACRNGIPTAGCDPASELSSEFFRYYAFARFPVPIATPPPTAPAAPAPLPEEDDLGPFVLQTWAVQTSDNLGPDAPAATDAIALSMLKQNQMFRYEVARKAVLDALQVPLFHAQTGSPVTVNLTLSSAGLPSIQQSLDGIRPAIVLESMENPDVLAGIWQQAGYDIARNIDAQTGGPFAQNLFSSGLDHAYALRVTVNAGSTPPEAFAAVYSAGDGATGAYQALYNDAGGQLMGGASTIAQQLAYTDVIFFLTLNAVPPVNPSGTVP